MDVFCTICFTQAAKEAARELVLRRKEECGAPGVTIAVTKNGRHVWAEGRLRAKIIIKNIFFSILSPDLDNLEFSLLFLLYPEALVTTVY